MPFKFRPLKPPGSIHMLIVNERIEIPLREIHFRFARETGGAVRRSRIIRLVASAGARPNRAGHAFAAAFYYG